MFPKYSPAFFMLLFTIFLSCSKTIEVPQSRTFSVSNNALLVNGDEFQVKGVVYVPGYPGFLPWEIENSTNLPDQLKASIKTDISTIHDMGANTVRLWGAPSFVYKTIKAYPDLHILQTLWIETETDDLLDSIFFKETVQYFQQVIDRIYKEYSPDDPPVLAYIAGNEISKATIESTNQLHPATYAITGNYINADGLNASEYFLAQVADWIKTYIFDHYANLPLVTYSNDIRTAELIDTPFLDFRSHNAYSYAIPYYLSVPPKGSTSGSHFQGWVEYLKRKFPEIPLLITETGLSVSPNATAVGPPDYGYGGNSETDQQNGILQNLDDIQSAEEAIAGIVIHEYLDAWWKFGLDDSYSQDPDDIEEWFGLYKLRAHDDWYILNPRPVASGLKTKWSQ